MNVGRLASRVGALLLVAIFIVALVPSIVVAADQVILDWETDANGQPILSGQVIDDEYHSTTGISVTVRSNSAYNGNIAAIFPSNAPPPTNGQVLDADLGSPNATCTPPGPGIGTGGEVGTPGENCLNHDNILIMPTTGAGSNGFITGVPNDDSRGGTISLIFSEPVRVDYAEILDQETTESLDINVYQDAAGATPPLFTNAPSGYGNNSYESIPLNVQGARRVDFVFYGSGAIASLAYTPSDPSAVRLAAFDAGQATPLYLLLAAALVALLTAVALWFRGAREG